MLIKRQRTQTCSKLIEPSQLELNKCLNLDYTTFLHVFYLSAQDGSKLLEPSYFRSFLIKLFDLEQYSEIHSRLKTEYQTLLQVQETKKVNKELYVRRFNRVKSFLEKLVGEQKKYQTAVNKYEQAIRQSNYKLGQATSKMTEVISKGKNLKYNQCPLLNITCDSLNKHKEQIAPKLEVARQKILNYQNAVEVKIGTLKTGQKKYQYQKDILDNRVLKARTLLYTIKEKVKDKPNPNIKRIKELEQIMPIFSNKGFPAYLLQVYTPVIQETANNLIKTVFPNMSIRIRPFRPNSNLPDFKVLVSQIDKKGEVHEAELTDFCGSENILVNICLRLGVIVIYKQLKDTCIDFMFVDEGLSKFDMSNSFKIIQLFENFIRLGYLNQINLITHKEELKKSYYIKKEIPIPKELENVNYIEL